MYILSLITDFHCLAVTVCIDMKELFCITETRILTDGVSFQILSACTYFHTLSHLRVLPKDVNHDRILTVHTFTYNRLREY